MRVLDVACGSGVHLLRLARRDVVGTGVEVAPSLVRYATGRAAEEGLIDRLSYLVDDMRDLTASPTQSLHHVARPQLGDVGSAHPDAEPPSGARTQLANGRLTGQTQAKQDY